jgi:hypothetical protein
MHQEFLDQSLHHVVEAPKDRGVVEMIVRRPAIGAREVVEEAELSPDEGLVGDSWLRRKHARNADGSLNVDTQLNVIGARALALVAGDRSRWPMAGDQLVIDLDLSLANLPPGTRLAIGTAVIEVSEEPHTGCGKFVERFGLAAQKLVNSPVGRRLNLRGINARVVQPGTVRVGDVAAKIASR